MKEVEIDFGAVSIEYALHICSRASESEKRTPNDADVFRTVIREFSQVIEASADALEKRIGSIKFDPIESEKWSFKS